MYIFIYAFIIFYLFFYTKNEDKMREIELGGGGGG
jgi:hypothetical protein